jgi:hypothetical protein
VWADWDGRLRCEPYILPAERSIEWVYSDDPDTTMLALDRTISHDYFSAPNRWVYYRTNAAEDDPPVEGDGIYTYQNDSLGETSVQARNGLVITKPVGVDAADQPALISQAQIGIQADMDIPTLTHVKTAPNPLHWHFDRLFVQDAQGLVFSDEQCTAWNLPLPSGEEAADMEQSWTLISM